MTEDIDEGGRERKGKDLEAKEETRDVRSMRRSSKGEMNNQAVGKSAVSLSILFGFFQHG